MQNGDFGELRNKLARFLEERTGGRVEVGGLERYPVGFSWQTFGFNAAWDEAGKRVDHSLILRMGPKYGVLAPYLAHDQFIALKALEGSGVPIPKVYWYCDDPAVLGLVFFIMDRVEGEAALPWTESGGKGAFDESIRPQLPRISSAASPRCTISPGRGRSRPSFAARRRSTRSGCARFCGGRSICTCANCRATRYSNTGCCG